MNQLTNTLNAAPSSLWSYTLAGPPDTKCHLSLHHWCPCFSFLALQSLKHPHKVLVRIVKYGGIGYAYCRFYSKLFGPHLTRWLLRPDIQFSQPKSMYGRSVHVVPMRWGS